MAKAQAKPKAESKRGQRNGDRRNGKAFKKHPKVTKPVRMLHFKNSKGILEPVADGTGDYQMPRCYLGYSHNRIRKMALQQYDEVTTRSVTLVMQGLKTKSDKSREYRRTTPAYLRRENKTHLAILHMRNRSKGEVNVVSVDAANPDGPMKMSTIGGNKR